MNLHICNTIDAAFATVPRFVRAVYDMLQNEDQRILSWSADGSRFQVYDVPRLETEVLRKYFKHDKFSSFQRQLNNFGFHKWTKTRASVATFSHDMLPDEAEAEGRDDDDSHTNGAIDVDEATSESFGDLDHPAHGLSEEAQDVPRDVCAVDELSDMSFASILEPLWLLEDDICSSKDDLLLLDALDFVELTALDWDAPRDLSDAVELRNGALLGGAFDVDVGTNDIDVDALLFV
ncbi:Heat shock transcription factor family [Phytophthora cactorum]|nr:Heat shock transcription factor family [Phytophthora cactorum]